jgi:abscisic acid G-protein coupled receptor
MTELTCARVRGAGTYQGIYLLSTLIQLRTSFPPAADGADAGLFSMLPTYETFGLVFDWSFLASAALAVAIEWVRGRAEEL